VSDTSWLPGDALPDAPALARRGPHRVGVTTRAVVLPDALDLGASSGVATVRSDRGLTLEIWYPAVDDAVEVCEYGDRLGRTPDDPTRPATPFTFAGRAARDAAAAALRSPLTIVSHGYPGSRVLLSWLCEHLASCGHVVVAIDHPASTHGAVGDFAETLLHRPTDILGTLDVAERLDREDALLEGRIDAGRTLLVGYSMGGYGVLNAAGAGFSEAFVQNERAVPHGLLAPRGAAALGAPDPRIRGVVAFAPWGGQHRVWDEDGLRSLVVPTLFVAGREDDVVGWQPGVLSLFAGTTGAERFLLVYEQGRHNVAPNPPPLAAASHPADWGHYAEPVWDPRRLNNVGQHFVRAFARYVLEEAADLPAALDLIPVAADGAWTVDADGIPQPGEGHWWGFVPRTALAMQFHRLPRGHRDAAPRAARPARA
jgi:predicted dienelactone hydrolase